MPRSEERRVGKEGRCRGWPGHSKKKGGNRDKLVTGVQTCALPIWSRKGGYVDGITPMRDGFERKHRLIRNAQIGRASRRERGEMSGVAGAFKKKGRQPR